MAQLTRSAGAINTVFKSLGKTKFGGGPVLNMASANFENGVIGGLSNWVTSGEKLSYQIARGAVVYGGAMAGMRALSGGGLYRDRSGRFDVIGVPFV